MKITVNEQVHHVEADTTAGVLRDRLEPDADLIIVDGAPAGPDAPLSEGSSVVLIRRGAIPTAGELESLMTARHTPGVHRRVRGATVGIAGVGGLGSHVAVALARTGVGKLILADFDLVEPSNLNRQNYFIDQIGMPKVEALRRNLERINPYITVETHHIVVDEHACRRLFADVDVMVEAFDAAEAKAMLTVAFRQSFPAKPLVCASGIAGHFSGNTIRTRRFGTNVWIVGDMENAAQPGVGLMAPRVGIAAHHQANAVLRLILGEDPAAEE